MLILTRKTDQGIVLGDDIVVRVLAVDGDRVKLGITAPRSVIVLREELSGFLASNGVFRDVLHYIDLLCAQIYSEYICEQGGVYLRTDFASEMDATGFTWRMLGLDGIDPASGRTRVKLADGGNFVVADR